MKRYLLAGLAGCLLVLTALPISAAQLLMVRSTQAFPEAMLSLQTSLDQHGYTVSRVQRVDVGLSKAGYKTGKYRVVFFGKPKEIERLAAHYPDLIPYLPLKIAIFAEGNNTLLVASNPLMLQHFFHYPALAPTFHRWARDIRSVLDEVRSAQ